MEQAQPVTGSFWCDECRAFFPDSIEDKHIEAHGKWETPTWSLFNVIAFWLACVAAGAVVALLLFAPR